MISPQTIQLVKDRADIVAVISEALPLKRFGRVFKACCPFHKEKTPSFNVDPERGWYHCFGCGQQGNALDFLIEHDGYTFPEAVRALAERFGVAIEENRRDGHKPDADRLKAQRETLYQVTALAAQWFQTQLTSHASREYALSELARRGLTLEDEVVSTFRLGYAPPSWDALAVYLRDQGVSPVDAQTLGLLSPRATGGYYDRFRHRLMFPVIDHHGRVVGFSGRQLADIPEAVASVKKEPPPKYINSPESPVYSKGSVLFGLQQAKAAIRQAEGAVLVEGNFDVVSLHARGLCNVVAPLGTAFTDDQARVLRRFTSNVIALFDGDGAGAKATRAARETCRDAGLSARVALLPAGTDPDVYVRTHGPEALLHLLSQSTGMLEYLLSTSLDDTLFADCDRRFQRLEQLKRVVLDQDVVLVREYTTAVADGLVRRIGLKNA